jgi:hypothetical protein
MESTWKENAMLVPTKEENKDRNDWIDKYFPYAGKAFWTIGGIGFAVTAGLVISTLLLNHPENYSVAMMSGAFTVGVLITLFAVVTKHFEMNNEGMVYLQNERSSKLYELHPFLALRLPWAVIAILMAGVIGMGENSILDAVSLILVIAGYVTYLLAERKVGKLSEEFVTAHKKAIMDAIRKMESENQKVA